MLTGKEAAAQRQVPRLNKVNPAFVDDTESDADLAPPDKMANKDSCDLNGNQLWTVTHGDASKIPRGRKEHWQQRSYAQCGGVSGRHPRGEDDGDDEYLDDSEDTESEEEDDSARNLRHMAFGSPQPPHSRSYVQDRGMLANDAQQQAGSSRIVRPTSPRVPSRTLRARQTSPPEYIRSQSSFGRVVRPRTRSSERISTKSQTMLNVRHGGARGQQGELIEEYTDEQMEDAVMTDDRNDRNHQNDNQAFIARDQGVDSSQSRNFSSSEESGASGSGYSRSQRSDSRPEVNLTGPVSQAPAGLLPARDSGYKIHKRAINKPTKLTHPTDTIPDATLMKRGLTRSSRPKMAKRASGTNDPENVLIVNMVENNALSWGQVADYLNADRIATGRNPSLTPNGVHNRYNRNAPLLFAAEGKTWVPIKDRKKTKRRGFEARWTADLDVALVDAYRKVNAKKWAEVAKVFNEATGEKVDAAAAAYRFDKL